MGRVNPAEWNPSWRIERRGADERSGLVALSNTGGSLKCTSLEHRLRRTYDQAGTSLRRCFTGPTLNHPIQCVASPVTLGGQTSMGYRNKT